MAAYPYERAAWVQSKPYISSAAPYKRALAARVCVGGTRGWRSTSLLCAQESDAGHDLVGGIDLGPGSNQPVHHLRMAANRRSVKRSPAVLRCEARQEVKRESCCPCQESGQRRVSWDREGGIHTLPLIQCGKKAGILRRG